MAATLEIIVSGDSTDAQQALDKIAKSLGVLGKDTEDAEKKQESFWSSVASFATGSVVADAIGGLVGLVGTLGSAILEAGNQASSARTILQGLADGVDMQQLLNDANMLSVKYGADVPNVVSSVKTLMEEFGLSGEEATNMVIAGFEKGMDTSGDYLDTLGEYSNLMAENGFTAEQFFSIMQNGQAGGVLGTDKIADSFKELGIRLREVPDEIFGPEGALRTGLGMTDEEVSELYDGMADGSMSVADAYAKIIPKLEAIENPIYRNTAGVALFGTQWEDLGEKAIFAADDVITTQEDIAAAADASRNSIGSLTDIAPLLTSKLGVALLPISDALIGMVNAFLQGGDPIAVFSSSLRDSGFGEFATMFQSFVGFMQTTGIPMIGGLAAAFVSYSAITFATTIPALLAQAAAATVAFLPFLVAAAPVILVAAIIGAAAALIIANWEPMAAAFSAAGGGIEGVGAALMTLGSIVYDWIANAVGPLIAALAVWATELWQWIAESWPKVVAQLGIWWGKFTTWLQSIPAKIPPLMVEWGKSMLSWISGLWDLAKPLFESWWGSIKTWFEGLPEIIKTTAGALGKAMIEGIGKGITDAAGGLLDSLRGAVDGAMDGVKHFFGIRSPSKVFRDEIGLNLGDGIALGLVSSIGTIRAASIAAGQAAMMGAGRGSGAMMAQSSSVNYNYNYAPVYSATPSNPTADFQMMQSLARTI